MISLVTRASNWSCEQLEATLLPVEGNLVKKVAVYAYQFFAFFVFLPLAVGTSLFSFSLTRLFSKGPVDSPLVAFAKHPKWSDKVSTHVPVDIGFASADFQENGPQTHPNTNWAHYYKKNAQKLGEISQVPDIWNHPERVIERLGEMGVKKYRFSISRDKIEPTRGGPIDQIALEHYRSFCRELIKNGIEPMITLHHFTDPTYFSWERSGDIDGFVKYAEVVADALYREGVRKIITINEPTVLAFQGYVMGEFPPHHTIDFEGAGLVFENMMRAHVRVYDSLKARHPDLEIGIAHDPIRFRNFHKIHPLWTPIEKILCHYLTELNHNAFFRFFQTGKFTLKVPFRANYSFDLSRRPPLDFIGLQYYTDPLIKLSFSGGDSVARGPEQKMTSYQYRTYPQGLASILEEFQTLGVPIDITEIGIDTGINADASDRERIDYFDRVFQVVKKAKELGVPVRSLHLWTLIDNLEWHKAFENRFGAYKFDPKTGQITPRPLSKWLKERIA